MRCKIFLEDLSDEMISRIKWVLRYDLADEINECATLQGIAQDVAEDEIISDYLNRHNLGFEIEL